MGHTRAETTIGLGDQLSVELRWDDNVRESATIKLGDVTARLDAAATEMLRDLLLGTNDDIEYLHREVDRLTASADCWRGRAESLERTLNNVRDAAG